MKQFFGSGFGRFRLVFRWCLGLFASKATACVLLFEAFGSGVLRPDFATGFFGSGYGRFRLVSRWLSEAVFYRARFRDSFAACFAVRGFRVCVLLFEAFGSDVPKARFREAQKIVVFRIPKVT